MIILIMLIIIIITIIDSCLRPRLRERWVGDRASAAGDTFYACMHCMSSTDTGVCEINTHPSRRQCRTPPVHPNVNVHGPGPGECNRSVK